MCPVCHLLTTQTVCQTHVHPLYFWDIIALKSPIMLKSFYFNIIYYSFLVYYYHCYLTLVISLYYFYIKADCAKAMRILFRNF